MPAILTGESAALHDFVNDDNRHIVAHLAKNDFAFELESLALTDFVECDFPGYEPVRIVDWIDHEEDDELIGQVASEFFVFQADGILATQNATAIYITLSEGVTAPQLISCEIFDQALVFSVDGQYFKRRVRLNSFDAPP